MVNIMEIELNPISIDPDTVENKELHTAISGLIDAHTQSMFEKTVKTVFDEITSDFYIHSGKGYFNIQTLSAIGDVEGFELGVLTKHYSVDDLIQAWLDNVNAADEIDKPGRIDALRDRAKIFEQMALTLNEEAAKFENNKPSTGFKM